MKIQQVARDKVRKLDRGVYGIKNFKDSVALLFQESIKFNRFSQRSFGERIGAFMSPYFVKRSAQPFKVYPRKPLTYFDEYQDILEPEANFFDIVRTRRSVREYQPASKMTFSQLFLLLFYSYGVTRKEKLPTGSSESGHLQLRAVPSAGGLYPLEMYILVFDAQFETGLYHYRPDLNAVELIKPGDYRKEMEEVIYAKPYVNSDTATAICFITSVNERNMIKYGDRGYRFILLEAGFVTNQLGLICEAIGLGSCMVGGYLDDKVNNFLGIDGAFETVQNIIFIGKSNEV